MYMYMCIYKSKFTATRLLYNPNNRHAFAVKPVRRYKLDQTLAFWLYSVNLATMV